MAEIAYSGAPIPTATATGAAPSPLSWDQLAQRNLQHRPSRITPVPSNAHRAAGLRHQAEHGARTTAWTADPLPDELMIDWGNTPPGSVATIYWPEPELESDVLALAHSLYASHLLTAADGHTIQCKTTRGSDLLPIPHVPA